MKQRKIVPLLIIFFLLVSSTPILNFKQIIVDAESENIDFSDEINLIGNGDFENTIKNTWDIDTSTGTSLQIDNTNSSPASKDKSSLKIGIGSGLWEYGEYLPKLKQTMRISSNKTYRFGMWSKFEGESVFAQAEVYLYDSNGRILWNKTELIESSQDWSEYKIAVPAYEAAYSIQVSVSLHRNILSDSSFGEFWLDSVSLKETKVELQTSILNDWNLHNNPSAGGIITQDTTDKLSGEQFSYKHSIVMGPMNWNETLPSQKQLIPISEDSVYNFSLADKGNASGLFLYLTLTFLNENQSYISSKNSLFTPETNWNQRSEYITTPKNAKFVQIVITGIRDMTSSSSGGDIRLSPNLRISKSSLVYSSSPELIKDGEFDDESMFNDWIIPSNSIGAIEREKNGRSGEHAVKFNYSSGDPGIGKILSATQEVNVEPNTVYSFSAWSKILSNTTIKSKVRLEFYEDDYTSINDALPSDTLSFSESTSWNKQELTFKTSPTTNKIKITLETSKSIIYGNTEPGNVLFDSVSLVKVNGSQSFLPIFPIDGTNTLKNESFQNGDSDWTISRINDSSLVSIANDTVEGTTDGKSLKVDIKPLNNDYGNLLIKQTIAVEPNTSYIFEGYTKGISNHNSIVRFNAEINNQSGTAPEKYFYRAPHAPLEDNTEWTKKILAFKTGVNATSVTITLQISYPDNTTRGSVIFDNLKLAKSNDLNIYDYSPLGGLAPFEPDRSYTQIFDDIYSNQVNWDEFQINLSNSNRLIESGIKQMLSGFSQMDQGMTGMNEGLVQMLDSYDMLIPALDEMIYGIEEMDRAYGDLIPSIDVMNRAVDDMLDAYDIMLPALDKMNSNIGGMNGAIDDILDALDIMIPALEELNRVMYGEILPSIEGLNNTGLINNISSLLNNMDGILGILNGLNSTIDSYLVYLNRVIKSFDDVNKKLDNVNQLLEAYIQDLNTLNLTIDNINSYIQLYNKNLNSFGNILYDLVDWVDVISYSRSQITGAYTLSEIDLGKINNIVTTDVSELNFSNINMSGFTLDGLDLSLGFPKYGRPGDPFVDPTFSLMLDLMPVIGELRAASNLVVKVHNSENLSTQEYVMAALGVVGGGKIKAGIKASGAAKNLVDEVSIGIKITENHRDNFKAYTGYKAKGEVHHGLPKEHRYWFEMRGLNVQDPRYLYDLPKGIHRLSKFEGIHTNNSPLGKEWNAIWGDFIDDYPSATKADIERQLLEMENSANISDRRAKPKKR